MFFEAERTVKSADTNIDLHDHLYSPVRLIDTGGNTYECYEYDAYGEPIIHISWGNDFTWLTADDPIQEYSAYGNKYLFTGREVDLLNGGTWKLQYNRNRYYDYYTGRWLTQDPLENTYGMNLYEYVSSHPINKIDPFGEISFLPPIGGIGLGMVEIRYGRSECQLGQTMIPPPVQIGILKNPDPKCSITQTFTYSMGSTYKVNVGGEIGGQLGGKSGNVGGKIIGGYERDVTTTSTYIIGPIDLGPMKKLPIYADSSCSCHFGITGTDLGIIPTRIIVFMGGKWKCSNTSVTPGVITDMTEEEAAPYR